MFITSLIQKEKMVIGNENFLSAKSYFNAKAKKLNSIYLLDNLLTLKKKNWKSAYILKNENVFLVEWIIKKRFNTQSDSILDIKFCK